jgi:carboxylesterase
VLFALFGIATAFVVIRVVTAWRDEREWSRRVSHGTDGVVRGAESFEMTGDSSRAVLLLHGFGDTPQTLRYLADTLHQRGWTVRAPLLPGHGRSLRAFAASSAAEWLDCARAELESLRGRAPRVAICGLSMGGALATVLAAETPDLDAVVLLAPYLGMPNEMRWLGMTHRVWGPVVPYIRSRGARSILDPVERARALGYGFSTGRLVRELMWLVDRADAALPEVRPPTLIVQSPNDNRIAPPVIERAFARLGASDKRLEWVPGGAHVITVDHEHQRVNDLAADWLQPAFEGSRAARDRAAR